MAELTSDSVTFSSLSAFKPVLTGFRILGLYSPKGINWLHWTYTISVHTVITFYYTLSLLIYAFALDSPKTLLANLSILFETILCALKVLNAFIKRKNIFALLKYLSDLDKCVLAADEKHYFKFILKMAYWFCLAFAFTFGIGGAVDDLHVLFAKERRLLYHAWFPWDWKNSTLLYHATHTYQVVGIYFLIIADVTCNLYPGLFYWLLKGHLRALGMRIKKIGYDLNQPANRNYMDLVQCIKDHKICLSYFNLCHNVTSVILLLQFICTQCVLCMTAVYLLFYNTDILESIYLQLYLICMLLEVSLSCYCGSALTKESENLTLALYSCNWMDQDTRFRKILIIFMQQTQKSWTIWAGGVVSVSLASWLSILKSSYSLYVVCSQLV